MDVQTLAVRICTQRRKDHCTDICCTYVNTFMHSEAQGSVYGCMPIPLYLHISTLWFYVQMYVVVSMCKYVYS